jgi:hypothetical protein
MPSLCQRYNNEQQADIQLDVIALYLSHISSPLMPLAVIVRKNSSDSNPYRLKTVDISRTFQLGECEGTSSLHGCSDEISCGRGNSQSNVG